MQFPKKLTTRELMLSKPIHLEKKMSYSIHKSPICMPHAKLKMMIRILTDETNEKMLLL